MSKSGGSGGGGRGKRSNFDAVPADDGFRNYMARKIELQRKQFGLVVPPPPPSPPPPVEPEPASKPAPPKILKRGDLAAGNREGVPIPQFANVNAPADASTEKSVRFHHEVEVEGETKPISMSHVLASLKQKHIGGRKRLSSSLKRRRRRSQSPTGESSANEQGSYSSVLGVLGNLQKRHGGAGKSALKRKRPHNDSQSQGESSVDLRESQEGTDRMSPSTLELLGSDGEVSFEPSSSSNRVASADALKRKRESPRCKGRSILEGLEPAIRSSHQDPAQEGNPLQLIRPPPASTPPSGSSAVATMAGSPTYETDASSLLLANAQPGSGRKSNHRADLFFAGVVVLVNGHTSPDTTTLMRLLHKHGGDLEKYETRRVTHIIAEQLSAAKANIYKRQKKPTPVVQPSWITDSVDQGKLLPYGDYLLKDVRDGDAAGTKSMKSFFSPKPGPTSTCLGLAKDGSPGQNDRSSEKYKDATQPEQSTDDALTDDSRWHRWRDKDPSEASYTLNGQVRTTGNDPNFLESYFRNSRLSYIGSFASRVKPSMNTSPSRRKAGSKRFVLLVDMDCFFANVALRKYPQYRGKPVAVGHCHIARSNATANEKTAATSKKNSSSELSTCNYVARQYGIRKGMFLGDAIQMCPDLVVLPYDFDGFEEVSGLVAELLHGWAEQYNGCVETVSCDESYVEVNVAPDDCQGQDMHVFLNLLAELIRADIVKKTECTASIGIGPNKLLAKLAADRVKPNARCVVTDWRGFLDNASLRDIPGVGRKLQKRLEAHSFSLVNDVWELGGESEAETVLGELIGRGHAAKIVQYCHGKDDRPVTPAIRKSIGAECNYGVRFDGPYGVDYMMRGLATEVQKRMTNAGVRGSKLVLKVMKSKDETKVPGKFLGHGRCDSFSRSIDISLTRDKDIISAAAMKLFHRLGIDKDAVRGMGIVISSLKEDGVEASVSSPTKLSAWLKKDSSPSAKLNPQAETDDSADYLFSEEDNAEQRNVSFDVEEEADRQATSQTSHSGGSAMPTFSQLDPEVLHSLPEDVLAEVKTMYAKDSSQSSQNASQSSSRSPKRSGVGKSNKKDTTIPIAGMVSVKRSFKLASIKSGEERLEGTGVTLSQLDNLPLELQLQVANGDSVEIAKSAKPKQRTACETPVGPLDEDGMSAGSLLESEDEVETCSRPALPRVNFHDENIAPLRDFITSNPDPDDEVVNTVRDYLFLCVEETRIDDVVTFLRTIKHMRSGWDARRYLQLKDATVGRVFASTGSELDTRWLGL